MFIRVENGEYFYLFLSLLDIFLSPSFSGLNERVYMYMIVCGGMPWLLYYVKYCKGQALRAAWIV